MTSNRPSTRKSKNRKNERPKNSDEESGDSGQEQEPEVQPSPVDDPKNKQAEKSGPDSASPTDSEVEPDEGEDKKAKSKAAKGKNKPKKVSKKNGARAATSDDSMDSNPNPASSAESSVQPPRRSARRKERAAAAKLGNKRSRSALVQEDNTNTKWSDTNLETTLLAVDMRQLLENRRKSKFMGRKQDMIEQLKKCKVRLSGDLYEYTMKQLRVECKLRNIPCEVRDRKDIVIARLRGDIEAPPQKRPKVRGRKKSKQPKNLVYVVIYMPSEESTVEEDDAKQDPTTNGNDKGDFNGEHTVLGVYKSEGLAYEKGCKQMLSDLKFKAASKRYSKVLNEIRDLNDKESLAYLVETLAELYKNNEEPYVTVHCSRLQG